MRHVGEKFTLRLVGSLHVAVKTFELDRSRSYMKRTVLFTEKPDREKEYSSDSQCEHSQPLGSRSQRMRRLDCPSAPCWKSRKRHGTIGADRLPSTWTSTEHGDRV